MADIGIAVEYTMDAGEVRQVQQAVDRLRDTESSPTAPEFYDRNWSIHSSLPERLRSILDRFRRTESVPLCLVHGFPVDDEAVGPTPAHWSEALESKSTLDQELFLAMCGLALGEPFTWSTLQAGLMIQNIFPIKGDERRQSGHGSEALLEFHTEDGFHPGRCDYLMLLGVRNHDQVPTIVASVRDVRLRDEEVRILSEPRFYILPDDEHIRQLETHFPDHPALETVVEMRDRPTAVPVLFGTTLSPYLRIDRPFMRCAGGDVKAERVLDRLMDELRRVQRSVVVGPGTLMVLDNYLAVHGRKSFTSRYDGTDRWLKRMVVSRDIRKSAASCAHWSRRVLC